MEKLKSYISLGIILFCFQTGFAIEAKVEMPEVKFGDPGIRLTPTVEAVGKAMPAVVNISTEQVRLKQSPVDQLFREYFGYSWQSVPNDPQRSLGSGVIIDSDGYLLTNYHVIERASKINITLAETKEQFEADVIATMPKTDLALLRIKNKGSRDSFPFIEFENADDLLLGEEVLTLGNPFGLGGSVSRGILSSKNRRPIPAGEQLEVDDWLQTDAAINLGNSGGPLINLNGKLIGINVATISEGQNIGFAIPIRRVMETIVYIFNSEKIKRSWIGMQLNPVAPKPLISGIEKDSPASQAGLLVGDIVTHFNNREIQSLFDLQKMLVQALPGEKFFLTLQRQNEKKAIIEITPIGLSDYFNAGYLKKRTGLLLRNISLPNPAALKVSTSNAFEIIDIVEESPAADAGLLQGDIITSINNKEFKSLEDLGWWFSYYPTDSTVDIGIRRPEYFAPARGNYYLSYKGQLKIN